MWSDLVEIRKRHTLRIAAIEAGRSNLDADWEKAALDYININALINEYKREMINHGKGIGEAWKWTVAIKGLGGGSLAAQLFALVDDIGRSPSISSLWRYAGQAVFDGKAERHVKGKTSHFNTKLKTVCWLISDQFIRQQTPFYSDIYYDYKAKQREKHPEVVEVKKKSKNGKTIFLYTDDHLHARARRVAVKMFLSHWWVTWRTEEGLPVSAPYVQAIMNHSGIYAP